MRNDKPEDFKAFVYCICGLILGFLLGLSFKIDFNKDYIDAVNMGAQVLMGLAAVIGLVTYTTQKKRETNLTAIDLISFFREKILELSYKKDTLLEVFRGPSYKIPRLRFELDTTNSDLKVKYPKEYIELLANHNYLQGIKDETGLQTALLNLMEELSQKIINLNVQNHKILYCIRHAFVRIVEANAFLISKHRELNKEVSMYSALLKVYIGWRDQTATRNIED